MTHKLLKKPLEVKRKKVDRAYRSFKHRLRLAVVNMQIKTVSQRYKCSEKHVRYVLWKKKKSEKLKAFIKANFYNLYTRYFNKKGIK